VKGDVVLSQARKEKGTEAIPDMDQQKKRAEAWLYQFKGGRYTHGLDCYSRLGGVAAQLGSRVSVVISGFGQSWGPALHEETRAALEAASLECAGEFILGVRPNAPREDVFRVAAQLEDQAPKAVVAVGGGSGIDGAKAAVAYWTLRDEYPEIDPYFGVGQVSFMLGETGRNLPPVMAVQLASGSAAHLTKYANITDMETGQKLLMIDEALVPAGSLFDYAKTVTMSKDFTMDGGLDGISHALEVYYGLPEDRIKQAEDVCLLAIKMIATKLPAACADSEDRDAREIIGLGTDLGGYAIMIGGTNGAHLTSFSLVDILPHGRACALMNPYYTVFFAPAIEEKLRKIGAIYKHLGYTSANLGKLAGRDLGIAVAEAMIAFSKALGFPVTLDEVPHFTPEHIVRALDAAKNPALESKLRNMQVPLSAERVDDYMGPNLEAARTGDFSSIRNMDPEA